MRLARRAFAALLLVGVAAALGTGCGNGADRSDRVGVRLTGPPLQYRWPQRQVPSEGTTRGAVQVPPNGQPVILGPDHPVTGGYPVVGVLVDSDTDVVTQLRPGQPLRLRWARPGTGARNDRPW